MADEARHAWLKRVLNVDIPEGPSSLDHQSWEPVVPIWQAAKDTADQQLRGLYDFLRGSDLPTLVSVADEIEGVLEDFRVGLVAALFSVDRSSGEARAKAQASALRAVTDARARLATDPHIEAADTNPFGVPVAVSATLDPALARLQQRLAA